MPFDPHLVNCGGLLENIETRRTFDETRWRKCREPKCWFEKLELYKVCCTIKILKNNREKKKCFPFDPNLAHCGGLLEKIET
jgi:hypothetical protein